jgi:phosphohistidine phosphatase SixA
MTGRAHRVFLARHGSRQVIAGLDESAHRLRGVDQDRTAKSLPSLDVSAVTSALDLLRTRQSKWEAQAGRERTESIAGALANELQNLDLPLDHILCSEHAVARDTAEVFAGILRERKCVGPEFKIVPCSELTPPDDLGTILEMQRATTLIIGHQPALTLLAKTWLRGNLPASTLPLGGSEVACLELGDDPRLVWLLTEKSPDLRTEILEKVKAKLDVAKFFLGALVVNASVLLNPSVIAALDSNSNAVRILLAIGLTAVAAAIGFSVATLLAFDRLTMPPEFWSDSKGPGNEEAPRRSWTVPRPPSEASIVLFYEMMHVWTHFFEPALGSALVAIVSITVALVLNKVPISTNATVLLLMAVFIGAGAFIKYYVAMRPRLGFDD